ncbi:MAG: protein kinase [Candidatus Sericytochromatia bacterium]
MLSLISDFEKNYKVERKIGAGGMGDVYLATDKRLERFVAVKVLKVQDNINSQEFIERFKNEAKSIAKLSHPNIVSIYDFGSQDDVYYMIMEYLEGNNLNELIEKSKQRIPHSLVVNVAIQMCNALQYAHDNKVIHRDIKPDNIILTNKGIVKLTDFGIVLLDKDKDNSNDQIVGSILYSSPEQLSDSSASNEKSDLYSLGVTLYEMLVGKNPFYTDDILKSIKSIMYDMPESPSDIYPEIPRGLSDIIMKTLEKNPNNRFENIKELKKEIAIYADQETLLENNFLEINLTNESYAHKMIKVNNNFINTSEYKSIFYKEIDNESDIIKNPNINKYYWIDEVIKIENGEYIENKVTFQNINYVLKENENFNGFIMIDHTYLLLFYHNSLIGALDILNNEIGDKAYESIPENCNSFIYKESISLPCLPVVISNILSNGIEIYKDLNKNNTNLKDFLSFFIKKNKFDGLIEITEQVAFKKNILYIEDDKIAQLLLTKYFRENDLPYELVISESIFDAIKKVNQNKYDLVILDYYLGDGTARDFISQNKSDSPIILTTSSNDYKMLSDMLLKEGIRDYIIKRSSSDYYKELSSMIKNIIGSEKIFFESKKSYISYINSNVVIGLSQNNFREFIVNNNNNILLDFDLANSSINIFTYNKGIVKSSINLILKNLTILISKKNKKISDYSFFLENDENLSYEIEEKIKENICLEFSSNNLDKNVNKLIYNSLYFKFSNWLIKNYFATVKHSKKEQEMFIIYKNIPEITKVKYFTNIIADEIPIVFYNKINVPIIFAKIGNGDFKSVNAFIEDSIRIKKNLESLESIIYISTNNYEKEINELFKKYTKNKVFSLFSKKTRLQGIIKIDEKYSIQINLLNYKHEFDSFDFFLPYLSKY